MRDVHKRGNYSFLVLALVVMTLGFGFLTDFDYSQPKELFTFGLEKLSVSGGTFLTGASVGLRGSEISISEGIGIQAEGDENSTWNLTYGKAGGFSWADSIAIDPVTDEVYVGGAMFNWTGTAASEEDTDLHLKKFSSSGIENSSWNFTFDYGDAEEHFTSIAIDSNSNVYSVGVDFDGWRLKKFHSDGTENITAWNKSILASTPNKIVLEESLEMAIVVGSNLSSGYLGGLILFYDFNGTFLDSLTYDSGNNDEFIDAALYNEFLYVVGYSQNFSGSGTEGDWRIFKYNISGTTEHVWNQSYDLGSALDNGEVIVRSTAVAVDDSTGDIFVGGTVNISDSRDWHIKKINSSGDEQWNFTYGSVGSTSDYLYDLLIINEDLFAIGTGYTITNDWHIKALDLDGNEDTSWNLTINNSEGYDEPLELATDSNFNIYMVGQIVDPSGDDYWAIKQFEGSGPPTDLDVTDNFNELNSSLWNYIVTNESAINYSYGEGVLQINGTEICVAIPGNAVALSYIAESVDFTQDVSATLSVVHLNISETLEGDNRSTSGIFLEDLEDDLVACDLMLNSSGNYILSTTNGTSGSEADVSTGLGNLTYYYNVSNGNLTCGFDGETVSIVNADLNGTINLTLASYFIDSQGNDACGDLDHYYDWFDFNLIAVEGGSPYLQNFTDDFTSGISSENYTVSNGSELLIYGVDNQVRINGSITDVVGGDFSYFATSTNLSGENFTLGMFVNLSNTSSSLGVNDSICATIGAENDNEDTGCYMCYNETALTLRVGGTLDEINLIQSVGTLTMRYENITPSTNCSFGSVSVSGTAIPLNDTFYLAFSGGFDDVDELSSTGNLSLYFDDLNFSLGILPVAEAAVEDGDTAFGDYFDFFATENTTFWEYSLGNASLVNYTYLDYGQLKSNGAVPCPPVVGDLNMYFLLENITFTEDVNATLWVNLTNTSANLDGSNESHVVLSVEDPDEDTISCMLFVDANGIYTLQSYDWATAPNQSSVSTGVGNLTLYFDVTTKTATCGFGGQEVSGTQSDLDNSAQITVSNAIMAAGGDDGCGYTEVYLDYFSATFIAAAVDNSPNLTLVSPAATGGGGGGSSRRTIEETNLTYTITEAQLIVGYRVNLNAGDVIKFPYFGETHSLTVDKIFDTYIKLTVESEPRTTFLDLEEDHFFEIDGDDYYDINVRLNFLNETADITLKKMVKKIPTKEPVEEPIAEEQALVEQQTPLVSGGTIALIPTVMNYWPYVIGLLFFALLVLMVLFVIGVVKRIHARNLQKPLVVKIAPPIVEEPAIPITETGYGGLLKTPIKWEKYERVAEKPQSLIRKRSVTKKPVKSKSSKKTAPKTKKVVKRRKGLK